MAGMCGYSRTRTSEENRPPSSETAATRTACLLGGRGVGGRSGTSKNRRSPRAVIENGIGRMAGHPEGEVISTFPATGFGEFDVTVTSIRRSPFWAIGQTFLTLALRS